MNDLERFEQEQIKKLTTGKEIPVFGPGDTVRVNMRVVEGNGKEMKTRIQAYQGVCIARGGKGVNLAFTVRKISYGEGVERIFPLYGPSIDSIELIRRGTVRRAKLYYLRSRSGKSARITERTDASGNKSSSKSKEKSTTSVPEKKAAAG